MRILLCEDDQLLQNQIFHVLKRDGYEVEVCSNLEELYERIDGWADLLLLDVHLPDGCVYEVIRMIRQENSVPILFFSADVEEKIILEGYSLDCQDYIEKPIRPRVLLAKIKTIAKREGLLETQLQLKNWIYRSASGELSLLDSKGKERSILKLQGSGARLFELLFRRFPLPVAKEVLCSALSRNTTDQTLRVRLSELRSQLPAGLQIQNIRGQGYRLEIAAEADR